MKKSLVLTLVVVYVLSICIVGYFGLNVRVYKPEVYPEAIEIIEVIDADKNQLNIKYFDDGSKYIVIPKYTEEYSLTILFRIYPDETTKKDVYYTYSEDICDVKEISNEIISEIKVTFKKKTKGEIISIISADQPTTKDSVHIAFKR